jgi:primary-amine oxidase
MSVLSNSIDVEHATNFHPLDPLAKAEITLVVSLVQEKYPKRKLHFVTMVLNEPSKKTVLNFKKGDPVNREAKIVLLDKKNELVYEAIVSLTLKKILSWKSRKDVQPSITSDEISEAENIIKKDKEFQEALKKRGVTNLDLVMVDQWPAGNFGLKSERGKRLARGLSWVRAFPRDNGYARPVEGLIAVVDLNKMEVIKIEDYGVVPLPPESANYAADLVENQRTDLKPLNIAQPEGPSFEVNGNEISWQKWRFRIGFTPREGLVLYTIGYEDQGRLRSVIYRASISEMVVPYGDPAPTHNRKNTFDEGELGLGMLTNSLELGCDCLGEIRYFDALITNSAGEVADLKNAICLHEEDFGIIWKHFDWRLNQAETRRSRRLVISFIATAGNYEYGFYWYFYQDGSIEFQTKLTGVLSSGAVEPGVKPKYGRLVGPQVYAPIHQHFLNVRLDMDVDGTRNEVYESHGEPIPLGRGNPFHAAFIQKSTLLKTERQAQETIDPLNGRSWRITNPHVTNSLGEPVAYRLVPGENVLPMASSKASITHRAGFMKKHLWVTPFSEGELYAAGDYPNQHPGSGGLVNWTKANRKIADVDLVVWYTMGHHHVPRPEDWPVMPVSTIGFTLKPDGFFNSNPSIDVPPGNRHPCCGVN